VTEGVDRESLGPLLPLVGHGGDLGLNHLEVSQIGVGHVPQSLVELQDGALFGGSRMLENAP